MRDPRCWREVFLRAGVMAIFVAIAYFVRDADPWVWSIPFGVALLVIFKWTLRPLGGNTPDGSDANRLADHAD